MFGQVSGAPWHLCVTPPAIRRFRRIGMVAVARRSFASHRRHAGDPGCPGTFGFPPSGSPRRSPRTARQPGPLRGCSPESIGHSSWDRGPSANRPRLDPGGRGRPRRAERGHQHAQGTRGVAGGSFRAGIAAGARNTAEYRTKRSGCPRCSPACWIRRGAHWPLHACPYEPRSTCRPGRATSEHKDFRLPGQCCLRSPCCIRGVGCVYGSGRTSA
ncbi:hypothetical protein J2S92_001203 [Arthrobacter bambusae]|nr:hypothetical protein [Arthrobacter bambusae]MDQ0235203.1 hypothetical protein [Arthrobacter bambusae]